MVTVQDVVTGESFTMPASEYVESPTWQLVDDGSPSASLSSPDPIPAPGPRLAGGYGGAPWSGEDQLSASYSAGQPGIPEWATPRGMVPAEYPEGTFAVPDGLSPPPRRAGQRPDWMETPQAWALEDARRLLPYLTAGGANRFAADVGQYARSLTTGDMRTAAGPAARLPSPVPWTMMGIGTALYAYDDYWDRIQPVWRNSAPTYMPEVTKLPSHALVNAVRGYDMDYLPFWLRYDLEPPTPPQPAYAMYPGTAPAGYWETQRWINDPQTRAIYPGEGKTDDTGWQRWSDIWAMPMPEAGVQNQTVPMPMVPPVYGRGAYPEYWPPSDEEDEKRT